MACASTWFWSYLQIRDALKLFQLGEVPERREHGEARDEAKETVRDGDDAVVDDKRMQAGDRM